jgi:ABC-type glycerol-3-phosphate transport system substrate-binding protein
MKNNSQLVVIIVFIVLAILGVLVFSGAIPIGKSTEPGALGTVTIWGTINANTLNPLLEEFNLANTAFVVKYIQKSTDSFDHDLLESLAAGSPPDLIFLPQDLLYHYASKIYTIPYASYPLASFKGAYAGSGEVFLSNNGVMSFPMYIDPLVMYYNRSMFDANGLVYPPAYWDEFENFTKVLNKKDDTNKIIKSAVALGHFSNIKNAKDILAAMFMQAGNPIISNKNGNLTSTLDSNNLGGVLDFYTNFADPNKSIYSWNKSFANSQDSFSKEDLVMYFGFASELSSLVNRNPNQNFFVASLPQIRNTNSKVTFGRVTGLAVISASKNFTTAMTAANLMASSDFASKLAYRLNLPPARRDLLQNKPTDTYSPIFYNSALYARSFVDPSPKDTDDIFDKMIEGVLANLFTSTDALANASTKMNILLLK